ncbi:hypothetical protein [Lysobacter sp. N42]|uniref:hypothetical protein n=1 Tax=Lysobacter sp. N42 TaxID=2545719 RepID=UPI001045DC8E|nr:hypothetical protein [Lysobacter sp. N42]TCZ82824.1 hypothetical protein EYQ95_22500 [Lysobacter sp. N42]
MTRTVPRILVVALAAAATLSACKRDEPAPAPAPAGDTAPVAGAPAPQPMPEATPPAAAVTDLQLGTAVGADNRVTSPATSFRTRDTLYASVSTPADASGTLGARWTYLGADGTAAPTEVEVQNKDLSAGTAATHEFHVSKPDGWPTGRYRVEITHNGQVVQTREFDVR